MKRIVVVGVVPVDRARRDKTFLVGGRRIVQRLYRGLLYLRVVKVQLAVLADDVLAAIGDQQIIKQKIGVIAVGRHLQAEAENVTHPLFAQSLLHVLEKIIIGVPGLRDVFNLVAHLLDQRPPYMIGQNCGYVGYPVKAALLGDPVVAIGIE